MELRVRKGCEGYPNLKVSVTESLKLTFAALLLGDVALVLQVVEGEDVLHLSLGVDDGSGAILDAGLDLLAQELLHVVWLLVGQKRCQVLYSNIVRLIHINKERTQATYFRS